LSFTSIINTTEEDVELFDPVVKVEELGDSDTSEAAIMGVTEQGEDRGDQNLSRGERERVTARLRDEHLNEEEQKLLREVCVEYQDVFYLPGEKMSCTNAARHSIQLQAGVTPINTRPYRLPKSQKEEIDRQVKQLVEDGIVTKSDSPWNSPLLIVPKKAGPDVRPKWRMIVDFRKLNEKTIGDAHPLPDITEILDQLGNLNTLHVWIW
jgi:hypothetical protein